MKIKPSRAEAFAAKPDRGVVAVLVYGPDGGLVRERADTLARAVVPDPTDPFCVVTLTTEDLARQPALLPDEAASVPFGGGIRLVQVRDGDDATAKAISSYLKAPPPDSFVLVTAGDLGPRAKLRQVFERADAAAALPCYRDDGRSLDRLITDTLHAHGLDVSRDAHAYLASHLGGDRQISRRELEKLALYVGDGRVEGEDAKACVGDNAALTLEDLAFACCGGDLGELERTFQRAVAEGANPIQIIRAVMRHVQRLHTVAAQGASDQAMDALRPPVFWKNKQRFKAQASAWRLRDLGGILSRLLDAEARIKTTGIPQESLASRVLFTVAREAPSKAVHRKPG